MVIPFLKVYIALTIPESTDSQSLLQASTRLKVYATSSIRNGITPTKILHFLVKM